jgi:hypothetical protein
MNNPTDPATAHAPGTYDEMRAAARDLAGRGYTVQTIAYSLGVSVEGARELVYGTRWPPKHATRMPPRT